MAAGGQCYNLWYKSFAPWFELIYSLFMSIPHICQFFYKCRIFNKPRNYKKHSKLTSNTPKRSKIYIFLPSIWNILHLADFFTQVCGVCDKYEVCAWTLKLFYFDYQIQIIFYWIIFFLYHWTNKLLTLQVVINRFIPLGAPLRATPKIYQKWQVWGFPILRFSCKFGVLGQCQAIHHICHFCYTDKIFG